VSLFARPIPPLVAFIEGILLTAAVAILLSIDLAPSASEQISMISGLQDKGYSEIEVLGTAPCGDSGIRFKARKTLRWGVGTETELVEGVACGKEKTVLEWFVLVETPVEKR
jgi:hypothetical protein